MAEGTAALRAAAAHWSLAGDQQLLDILQNIHQGIITRCNETTARLELMSRGLRDASVNLQNVNNKFLALSNTQFVESRVYEDDTDLAPPPAPAKELPRLTDLSSELAKLKQSLRLLESYHEPLHILRDSDSDSDSDAGDDRLVFKPKDLYSDRPLPYIIGSQAWKTKWHAGLIQDESDSDSSTSKVEELEQYSESEDEQTDRQLEREYQPARKQSTGSSSVQSEVVAVSVSPVRPSPSLVAAELARRLGGDVKLPEREPVYREPETTVRKLYKPQQTPSAPIFPEEPPPLDSPSDEDIFAELHRPQRARGDLGFGPNTNSLEEALFGRPPDLPDPSEVSEPLFEDDLMPEVRPPPDPKPDDTVKKPIGGISLFGTNKHAESIGAAILNRNRRKSSTSSDEGNTAEVRDAKHDKVKETNEVKKERDIFDDLFAKSEKLNRKNVKVDEVKVRAEEVKKKEAFSDIFDDIDDIFSTDIVNVQIKETKRNEKPLFDDDDDLFADIPKAYDLGKDKVKINEKNNLFNDIKSKSETIVKDNKVNVIKEIKKESKSLFDSDSDDGLFTNVTRDNVKDKVVQSKKPVEYKISDDIFGDDDESDDLFASSKAALNVKPTKPNILTKPVEVSKTALFDSDDELFANGPKESKTIKDTVNKNDVLHTKDDSLFVTEVKRSEKELKDSKSINDSSVLFESDEKSKALKVVESINNDIFNDGDDLFKKTETIKESRIETVHDSFDNEKLFSNNKLLNHGSEDEKQGSEDIQTVNRSTDPNDFKLTHEDDIFDTPDTQTGNILRTTRIAADEENMQTDKPKHDEFHNSDDDLFRAVPPIPKPQDQEISKNDYFHNEIPIPESPEIIPSKTNENDIFSDIFDDVPPIFEKPKEPKKSQNVNALYGDDSDDEALFFKKNDVINDEKPEFSPSGERFGIFNDEPPALDVDFEQKPTKTDNFTQSTVNSEEFTPKFDANDSTLKSDKIDNTAITIQPQDTTDNTSKEPKKIGKLKPMNFNINVNTLLPGGSPKKKQPENTDGHTASNEELHKTDKIEPKMVKSISFDDPEILDNKISKERAKIQVKRRPSTRRARREAVRKSAVDLTDSSFDSSNDNSAKDDAKVVKTVYILNDEDIFGDSKKDNITENTKKHLNIVDSDEELFKKDKDGTDNTVRKDNNNHGLDSSQSNEKKSFLYSDDDDLFKRKDAKLNDTKQDSYESKTDKNERKTFLDSDDSDDMFKTNVKTNTTAANSKASNISDDTLFKSAKNETNKSFLDSDDNDGLFTNKTKVAPTLKANMSSDDEDLFTNANTKGVETLGKVYKADTERNKTKATNVDKVRNVFDDFPPKPEPVVEEKYVKPQEIKQVAKVEKAVVKKSILDVSSDEDDLFKAKTKLTSKKDDKSLFGDDNDDDLFGAKAVIEAKKDVPPPQSVKEAKPTETVFVDPLSLFGDDD